MSLSVVITTRLLEPSTLHGEETERRDERRDEDHEELTEREMNNSSSSLLISNRYTRPSEAYYFTVLELQNQWR